MRLRRVPVRAAIGQRAPAEADVLDLSSTDYLGLARHAEVLATTSDDETRPALAERLAQFTGAGRALLVASEHLAVSAAVHALAHDTGLVVSDGPAAPGLPQAAAARGLRLVTTPARDVAAVEVAFASAPGRRGLLVTPGVCDVTGSAAPLPELYETALRHGARLLVLESHSLGVVGSSGQGTTAQQGLAGAPDLLLAASLGNALGSRGAAVLGPHLLVERVAAHVQSALVPHDIPRKWSARALAALGLLEQHPQLAEAARRHTSTLHRAVVEAGWSVRPPSAAVLAMDLGSPLGALVLMATLEQRGLRASFPGPGLTGERLHSIRMLGRANLLAADLEHARTGLLAAAADLADRGASHSPRPDSRPWLRLLR